MAVATWPVTYGGLDLTAEQAGGGLRDFDLTERVVQIR